MAEIIGYPSEELTPEERIQVEVAPIELEVIQRFVARLSLSILLSRLHRWCFSYRLDSLPFFAMLSYNSA
jgi:hypothetical protein